MDRILFIHRRNDFTGSTRVLANLIETEFVNQRVKVIALAGNGFLSLLPNVCIINIKCFRFRGKTIPLLSSLFWRLSAIFLVLFYGGRYDVFYINTIMPYYAAIIGRLLGKKIIYHVHEKFITKSLYVRIAEYVFNHIKSKRIYVSQYLKNQYIEKKNCETVVKYNTLPRSFLSNVQIVPIEERKRNTLLMITSLSKGKGLCAYIEIAKCLPEYTFCLLISADMGEIMKFFHYNVPDNVEIIAKQSDVHPFLHKSDLLLNLSIPSLCVETFGMTILEAMAYGIPAIVPNVGGPTELVINGCNGYCVDVTNVSLVTDTIKKCLDEKNYKRLATNALKNLDKFI